ncbi:hypothetical protein BASA50_001580 [Batrachochytrium salamandrivorans]|uniref:Transmembrane protein n=1 Tax=Batrachochytrium salamandrivorans TaxID=1357716 RepID=A0ABQ8FNP5_9FUNG|nr:hypothetical protein BASA60_011560 [Batrachochytrium salamandrivorans]KAH6572985.1 hypothetical protein BASA62_003163 [Batrachochytrium salamandrivorans]KAH6581144.1 hypothetical protein BASA61_009215 [Batrachochytrium salamandrivorans]KAH6601437.1 hypothetical protein BASA50_001580 [Batrachochytrium salamandrivorans]KAH9264258.1 hypothetical protein BASA83_012277 [Batrachochytrium salamandrivorans]
MLLSIGGVGGWANWSLTLAISVACTVATGAVVVAATSMLLHDHNQTVLRNEFKLRYKRLKTLLRAVESEFLQILPLLLSVEALAAEMGASSTTTATPPMISPAAEEHPLLGVVTAAAKSHSGLSSPLPNNHCDGKNGTKVERPGLCSNKGVESPLYLEQQSQLLQHHACQAKRQAVLRATSLPPSCKTRGTEPLSPPALLLPESPSHIHTSASSKPTTTRQTQSVPPLPLSASKSTQPQRTASHISLTRDIFNTSSAVVTVPTSTFPSLVALPPPLTALQISRKLSGLDDQVMHLLERLDNISLRDLAPPGLILESLQPHLPTEKGVDMASVAHNALMLFLDAFGAGRSSGKAKIDTSLSSSDSSASSLTSTSHHASCDLLDAKTHGVVVDGIDAISRSKKSLATTLQGALERIDRAFEMAGIPQAEQTHRV